MRNYPALRTPPVNRHTNQTGQDSNPRFKAESGGENETRKPANPALDEYARSLQILKSNRISKGLRQAVEEYCQAVSLLRGTPLVEAVSAFARRRRLVRPITIGNLVDLYARSSAGAAGAKGNRKRLAYLEQFAASFPGELKDLDGQELQVWLDGLTGTTPERHLRECRAALADLFHWARRQRYWAYNEALPTDTLELKGDAPESRYDLLVAADLQTLLIAARKAEKDSPHILRAILLGGLAGLRYEEIAALRWEEVSLVENHIHVPGASTARRVRISPSLARWLRDLPRKDELVVGAHPMDAHQLRLETVRLAQQSQLTWPRNALRNAWLAHTVALLANPGEVSAQAGLETTADLAPYLGLVTPAEAQAWFSIVPEWCAISD